MLLKEPRAFGAQRGAFERGHGSANPGHGAVKKPVRRSTSRVTNGCATVANSLVKTLACSPLAGDGGRFGQGIHPVSGFDFERAGWAKRRAP
ncbi:MAG: hypothetical protein IJC63_06790, partial [Myxococcaceae bacterium]|nr:hypothetical protein [Myxococcaceae bacterium]